MVAMSPDKQSAVGCGDSHLGYAAGRPCIVDVVDLWAVAGALRQVAVERAVLLRRRRRGTQHECREKCDGRAGGHDGTAVTLSLRQEKPCRECTDVRR